MGIFGVAIFLHFSRFFVKGDFVVDGVECMYREKARLVYRSTVAGAVLKSKCDMIIQQGR